MKSLAYLLLLVEAALGTIYYVESAPAAPYLCTVTQPCRLQDLPGTFTTSDSVVFVPATTGSSSTFSSATKTLNKASVTVSAGLTFSAFTLNVANANSLTCTGTTNFQSGSTLATATVTTISVDGCNFDNSQLVGQVATTITFQNAAVSGMTSSKKIQLQGTSVTVDTVSFSSGSTSVPALYLITTSTGTGFTLNSISMTDVTTTGTTPLVLMQSINSRDFSATVQSSSFTRCVSGGALVEMRINGNGSPPTFNCDGDMQSLTAVNGSVTQGLFYFNNNHNSATMSAIVAVLSATGVNYGNNSPFLINANPGVVGVNGWQQGSNALCGGINEADIITCTGTQANGNMLLNGNTDGPTSVSGCGATTLVNMGSNC